MLVTIRPQCFPAAVIVFFESSIWSATPGPSHCPRRNRRQLNAALHLDGVKGGEIVTHGSGKIESLGRDAIGEREIRGAEEKYFNSIHPTHVGNMWHRGNRLD